MTSAKRFAALFAILIIIALFPLIILYAMLRAIPAIGKHCSILEAWLNEELFDDLEGYDLAIIVAGIIFISLCFNVAFHKPVPQGYDPDQESIVCESNKPCY